MQSVFVVTAVVGLVEFLRRVHLKDYFDALTIAGAALIGGLAGLAAVDGLTVVAGITAGLGASGLVKVAGAFNSPVLK